MAIVLKSQKARDFVRDLVVEEWARFKEDRLELEQKWIRCLLSYLSEFDKKWAKYALQAGRSCRYVPLNYDAVETVGPQVFDAVMGQTNWISIEPERMMFNSDDDKWAAGIKLLIEDQFRKSGFKKSARLGFKQLLMLGNCPFTLEWRIKRSVNYRDYTEAMLEWVEGVAQRQQEVEGLRAEYQKITIQAQLAGEQPPPMPELAELPRPPKDLDIIFQGPVLSIGDIFNYVQEQHPDEEENATRIMRTWRSKSYLKELSKEEDGYALYENLSSIQETESPARAKYNDAEILMKMAMGMILPNHKDSVELKERQGTINLDYGDGEGQVLKGYIATVANDNTLIRCEPSPLFSGAPLLRNARLTIIRGAVYGRGILEPAMDEQDSANALHNQSIDAVNCVIQPEMEVIEDNLVGPMKPSGPGARHSVLVAGTFTPIRKDFQGLSVGFAAVAASTARHERITGAVNTGGGSGETATLTVRNSGITSAKLGSHVVSIEDEFLTPILNMAIEMNAQYVIEDQITPIIQDRKVIDSMTIPPHIIRRGWVAKAEGSRFLVEQQKRVENLMMAVQVASQADPEGKPSRIDKDELYKMLFREILGETADGLIKDEEVFKREMAAWEQQRQLQQQIMMQRESGNNGGGQGGQPGQN